MSSTFVAQIDLRDSDGYQRIAEHRRRASAGNIVLVDGRDR